MSFYQLLPPPHEYEPWAFWENGITALECQRIREIGESLLPKTAVVGEGRDDPNIRRSKTSWLTCNQDTSWIYDRLGYIVRQLNGQYFGFDITGFSEDLQYTVYQETNRGHYDFHVDNGFSPTRAPRKLSITLQLSSPEEYEGGELELRYGKEPAVMKKEQGIVVAFPSFTLHRVKPITKGTRRSLVAWLTGPRWL